MTFASSGENWYVWVHQAGDVDAPANLGVLKLSDEVSSESFKLHIWNEDGATCTEKSTCPGAVDIGSICLDAESCSDVGEWTGHSSIAAGAAITGELGSMILVKDSGGGGGSADGFTVGTVTGDVTLRKGEAFASVRQLRGSATPFHAAHVTVRI